MNDSLSRSFQQAMSARFGDQFSVAKVIREHHGRDESRFDFPPPDAVLFAESTEDVAAAVTLCRDHGMPIIPYGAGSSVEGHLIAVRGGLSIDLSRMNNILAVRPDELSATVQAGVTRKQLNEALKGTGLFFPIDPGADATIGGMVATGLAAFDTALEGQRLHLVRYRRKEADDRRLDRLRRFLCDRGTEGEQGFALHHGDEGAGTITSH